MKKLFCILISLIILFTFSSCINNTKKDLSELNFDFNLEENQDVWLCYESENDIIITVGKDSGKEIGPVIKTEYLAMYDLENNRITDKYYVDTDAYIANVVPYENGILYVDYEGFFENVEWHLIYAENDLKEEIDSGTVSSYERVPYLTVVNDVPVCLIEEDSVFSVSSVENKELNPIYRSNEYQLDYVNAECNASMYCFTVTDKESNEGKIFIGDISGIKNICPLENKITSFSITDNFAVFALGTEETEEFYIQLINLKNGETETVKTDTALWRMTGGKDICLCVDSSFNIFSLNTGEKTLEKADKTDSYIIQNSAVAFHHLNKDEFIVRFDSAEQPYNPLFYIYK